MKALKYSFVFHSLQFHPKLYFRNVIPSLIKIMTAKLYLVEGGFRSTVEYTHCSKPRGCVIVSYRENES